MSTDCRRTRGALPALLDGELPVEGRRRVEAHLEACAACRAELEALRAAKAMWQEAPGLASTAADRARVVAAAHALLAGPQSRRLPGGASRRVLRASDLVTAAALAASLVLGVMLHQGQRPSGPPAGWPRSSVVLTAAELRARQGGAPIETGAAARWVGSF